MNIFATVISEGENSFRFPSVISETGSLILPIAGMLPSTQGKFLVHGKIMFIGGKHFFVPSSIAPAPDAGFFAQLAGDVNTGKFDGTGLACDVPDGFYSGLLVSIWGGSVVFSGSVAPKFEGIPVSPSVINTGIETSPATPAATSKQTPPTPDQLHLDAKAGNVKGVPVAPAPGAACEDAPAHKVEPTSAAAKETIENDKRSPAVIQPGNPPKEASQSDSKIPGELNLEAEPSTPTPSAQSTKTEVRAAETAPPSQAEKPRQQTAAESFFLDSSPSMPAPTSSTPVAKQDRRTGDGKSTEQGSGNNGFAVVSPKVQDPFPVAKTDVPLFSSRTAPLPRGRRSTPPRNVSKDARFSHPTPNADAAQSTSPPSAEGSKRATIDPSDAESY